MSLDFVRPLKASVGLYSRRTRRKTAIITREMLQFVGASRFRENPGAVYNKGITFISYTNGEQLIIIEGEL